MAQFVRGKQAGVSNDLSAGIVADIFALDIVNHSLDLARQA